MPQQRVSFNAPRRVVKREKQGQFGIERERVFARTASIFRNQRVLGVCPLAVRCLPTEFEMPPRSLAPQLQSFAFVAILGSCLTGCTWFEDFFDESVSLTELAPVGAKVSAEFNDTSRSQLVLQPKDGMCPTIRDDVAATVDDESMDVYIKGGKQPSGSSWICGMPTFRRNVAATDIGAESTKFVADDDTKTITVVATGLFLDRTMKVNDPTAPLEAGVEKEFVWSVATDEIDPDNSMVDFVYDDPNLMLTAELTLRIDGSSMFVRLPMNAPEGPGTLTVDVTSAIPIETCDGVSTCSGSVHVVQGLAMNAVAPKPSP